MIYREKETGLLIANTDINPLLDKLPLQEEINKSASNMILSASGWRKVFAKSGDEEDSSEELSLEDKYLSGYIALSLAKHLNYFGDTKDSNKTPPTVLIGMDARPTGPAICDIITRVFISLGINVKSLFIASAPEIMAYSALEKDKITAFLYISASHNPIGHNGIKFGYNGGVYTSSVIAPMISDFKEFSSNEKYIKIIKDAVDNADIKKYEEILDNVETQKNLSLSLYREFALKIAAKEKNSNEFLNDLKEKLKTTPIGIIGELNGSARSTTIDRNFFNEIGVKSLLYNDRPREIVHPIVPEGENLELCRTLLENNYKEDKDYVVGYVPDNDGDRGNLVYIKKSSGKAEILQAQEVFALVVMAELSAIRAYDKNSKLAISVNGPTSNRIDEICKALDVSVFRAEVGEANVVELAQIQRDKGFTVRILGEGSNGGNITYPAKVRDPLNTIMSLISILSDPNIFEEYRKRVHYTNPELSIENMINSLPSYTTTDAFSPIAKLHVKSSHGILKTNYERELVNFFSENIEKFNSLGIFGWEEYQMEGTSCVKGMGENFRSAPYKGGLKIVFTDREQNPIAFTWMRGSGTEPVFRILVDCKDLDNNLYDFLLEMHIKLLNLADM
jgi:phosphomannomutase